MPMKILVIDDDKALRLLYQSELTGQGYQVDTAATGQEALDLFAPGHYEVAVVDIEMPDISGLDLIGRLRELAPGTALILNSAYSTYKADFKSWMADGYIVKSSDLTPLTEKIKELVAARESR